MGAIGLNLQDGLSKGDATVGCYQREFEMSPLLYYNFGPVKEENWNPHVDWVLCTKWKKKKKKRGSSNVLWLIKILGLGKKTRPK